MNETRALRPMMEKSEALKQRIARDLAVQWYGWS